jgi:septum formation protein
VIVLASASPRRHDLLRAAGLDFQVQVAGVDETLEGDWDPEVAAGELALRKAKAVAAGRPAGDFVIGADTIVALAIGKATWRLLGKPADAGEARDMLNSLSGSRHKVITGVAVIPTDGSTPLVEQETTWVTMRRILPLEVEAYVLSEEWRDKAGGYAIQENADVFVTNLEGGGFDNVVGLPVGRTLGLLARAGACGLPATDL